MKAAKSKLAVSFWVADYLERVACTAVQATVLQALALFANPDGTHIFPGLIRLSRRTHLAQTSIIRAIEFWLSKDVLVLDKKGAGRHRASEYHIDMTSQPETPSETLAQGKSLDSGNSSATLQFSTGNSSADTLETLAHDSGNSSVEERNSSATLEHRHYRHKEKPPSEERERAAQTAAPTEPAPSPPPQVEVLMPAIEEIKSAFDAIKLAPFGPIELRTLWANVYHSRQEGQALFAVLEDFIQSAQRMGRRDLSDWIEIKRRIRDVELKNAHQPETPSERRQRKNMEMFRSFEGTKPV